MRLGERAEQLGEFALIVRIGIVLVAEEDDPMGEQGPADLRDDLRRKVAADPDAGDLGAEAGAHLVHVDVIERVSGG